MLNKKMEEALNAQIQEEIYSSYLYLSMAAYCAQKNFLGFAHWMKIQSKEEWGHAIKLLDYLNDRGGAVVLREIKKPPHDFKSIRNVIEMTLEHEKNVTGLIHKLFETAGSVKDYATQSLLQWYINEQVEEEAGVSLILEKIKMIADKSSGLLYLDKELGKREG